MNIFALHCDPTVAAEMHCDKHVIKMITETAQLLSTALREHGVDDDRLYKRTHVNHPCAKWVRECRGNFDWARRLLAALLSEYEYRYGREDKFIRARQILVLAAACDLHIPSGGRTSFAQAMPESYKSDNPISAYRAYYIGEKLSIASWTRRNEPSWIRESLP
jgi:hypothetical protein